MQWLKRRLIRWLNEDQYVEILPSTKRNRFGAATVGGGSSGFGFESECEPMRLHVYSATGGTIVETRTYDRIKDRSNSRLHIVAHDEDLGESLAKIILMENLRG